ncbi:DUF2145 domain-containing protein [uncultured Piscinibacter sp.]|uniref:DUF2145 domain-containing protein n=1 Tax=uncultured Piscinibacter sp. TaxID=1131835 RepID=UPI00261DE1B9|nr:DUF2145 domain-containing protein [uncultured Piscinibacter sp.]
MKAALLLTLALSAGAAHAGRTCENQAPDAVDVQRAMTLAERTARALDASGAQVVVLARAGQDLSRYGLAWSHLGLAYREGRHWRVVHKLNQCGSARAALYRQGLGEFFLDDLHEYKAGILVPEPAVQAKLLMTLRDDARVTRLNTPAYSMLAYPWSQRYQQSNQWALETMAMAQDPAASTRERAQAWLMLQGYEPTPLRLGALTRLGARATAANIAFDDHPNEKRFTDRIETVTVDSVFAWLNRSGLGGPVQVVR